MNQGTPFDSRLLCCESNRESHWGPESQKYAAASGNKVLMIPIMSGNPRTDKQMASMIDRYVPEDYVGPVASNENERYMASLNAGDMSEVVVTVRNAYVWDRMRPGCVKFVYGLSQTHQHDSNDLYERQLLHWKQWKPVAKFAGAGRSGYDTYEDANYNDWAHDRHIRQQYRTVGMYEVLELPHEQRFVYVCPWHTNTKKDMFKIVDLGEAEEAFQILLDGGCRLAVWGAPWAIGRYYQNYASTIDTFAENCPWQTKDEWHKGMADWMAWFAELI